MTHQKTMNMPSFSVIIPTYNNGNVIKKAIDSVLDQKYPNVEIIVVNDGSTDNTGLILDNYQNISNIIILNQKNSGPFEARKNGIKNCHNDYICFLDADDIYKDIFFNRIVFLINKYKSPDLIHFGFDVFSGGVMNDYGSEEEPLFLETKEDLVRHFASTQYNKEIYRYVFKRIIIDIEKIGNTGSLLAEDSLMAFSFICKSNNGLYTNESLYIYNLIPKKASITDLINIVNIEMQIYQKASEIIKNPKEIATLKERIERGCIDVFEYLYVNKYNYSDIKKHLNRLKEAHTYLTRINSTNKYDAIKKCFIKKPSIICHLMFKLYYAHK